VPVAFGSTTGLIPSLDFSPGLMLHPQTHLKELVFTSYRLQVK
jgi:hypothetical protein